MKQGDGLEAGGEGNNAQIRWIAARNGGGRADVVGRRGIVGATGNTSDGPEYGAAAAAVEVGHVESAGCG